jgi:hypothetical protein
MSHAWGRIETFEPRSLSPELSQGVDVRALWSVGMYSLALSACAVTAGRSAPEHTAAIPDSAAVNGAYEAMREAYARLDVQALAALFTSDGVFGGDTLGFQASRPLIDQYIGGVFEAARADSARLDLTFRFVRRFRAPGLATDAGYYQLQWVGGSRPTPPTRGWFVAALVPDSTGRWRFAIDMDVPLAQAAFEAAGSSIP